MAVWSTATSSTDTVFHEKMVRFSKLISDPVSIIDWTFSDQAIFLLSLVIGLACIGFAAWDLYEKVDVNGDKIPLKNPLTKIFIGLWCFALPFALAN